MPLKNYFDFAEDDYKYFARSCERDDVACIMGSIAQNICEKYIKHLIEKFDIPADKTEEDQKEEILTKHNLNRLMKYMKTRLNVTFSEDTTEKMKDVNGYYYDARYPGDFAFDELTRDDIKDCYAAVKACRKETLELIQRLEKKPSLAEKVDAAEQRAGVSQKESPAKENER